MYEGKPRIFQKREKNMPNYFEQFVAKMISFRYFPFRLGFLKGKINYKLWLMQPQFSPSQFAMANEKERKSTNRSFHVGTDLSRLFSCRGMVVDERSTMVGGYWKR